MTGYEYIVDGIVRLMKIGDNVVRYRAQRCDEYGGVRHDWWTLGLDGVYGMQLMFEQTMEGLWAIGQGEVGQIVMMPYVVEPVLVCDQFEFVGPEVEVWYNVSGRVFESRLTRDRYQRMRFSGEYMAYCHAVEQTGRGVKLFDGRKFGIL